MSLGTHRNVPHLPPDLYDRIDRRSLAARLNQDDANVGRSLRKIVYVLTQIRIVDRDGFDAIVEHANRAASKLIEDHARKVLARGMLNFPEPP
jgi:hypothetical protein